MTREEMMEKLENLEHDRWLMDMIDRWLPCDWERVRELDNEILDLKRKLKALED